MNNQEPIQSLRNRQAPLELNPDQFRQLGYMLVDHIADFLQSLPGRPVTPGESPEQIRLLLGDGPLPHYGVPAEDLLRDSANLLFDHSLFNSHPRFWGYITSSAAPIGMLGDLLAASVNPNVGAWVLSPLASEIESQTIRWIAELIGYPSTGGGILVSGGNMANFVGFLAARRARLPWDVRSEGLRAGEREPKVYVSKETHTWIQKAADLFGLGLNGIRWIPTNQQQQMDTHALEQQIVTDMEMGALPLLVVGTAGTVGVGAVDPLPEIAEICKKYELWFHVDGAYGAPAAALHEAPPELKGLSQANSVAIDPHKWLYVPLEVGCTLVREMKHLADAFSFHPEYYNFDASGDKVPINFYEFGPQNSRGFRALKVWLALRLVGREGYMRMIRDDIALAKVLYQRIQAIKELQAFTHNLSITTFRFLPADLTIGEETVESYLNDLNREILNRLQNGGEAYVSNAVLDGTFVLRACIVNFHTMLSDIEALPEIVVRLGREVDSEMRSKFL